MGWLGYPLYVLIYRSAQLWCWLRGVNYPSRTPIKKDPSKPVFLDFEGLKHDGDA